jgi:hypothetical protein
MSALHFLMLFAATFSTFVAVTLLTAVFRAVERV